MDHGSDGPSAVCYPSTILRSFVVKVPCLLCFTLLCFQGCCWLCTIMGKKQDATPHDGRFFIASTLGILFFLRSFSLSEFWLPCCMA
ncbi:hypothetical protein B0T19DRAFT_408783 [Cercophora scortea]|uniref:Uncharacterized protein n=1 Tax=Cercophora scortea TaxID=314031 RepID=A0AAE0ML62_9PEZI|nr:hypothetical protein B0T19DRAFT_408783 [Cercophora scortea]